MKGSWTSTGSSSCVDASWREVYCHWSLERDLTQLILFLLGRCSNGVSAPGGVLLEESGRIWLGFRVLVGFRVRDWLGLGGRCGVCFLVLLGF